VLLAPEQAMSEAAMTNARDLVERLRKVLPSQTNREDWDGFDPLIAEAADALDAAQERERGLTEVLELIEVDLDAGDMAPKTRVKLALSRVRAALGDPNA
jgi:hypothetical protein